MARLSFVRLEDENGNAEAVAIAYDNRPGVPRGTLLPPGQWFVRKADEENDEVMDVEDMPYHWQEQLKRWGEFGRRLE